MIKKKKYSVLLVEDEKASQELLITYLKTRQEFELKDIAVNGKKALNKLRKNIFDLVFLDINLPFLSGLEVIRKLKYKPYFIVMNSKKENAYNSNELGGIDFLLKPITLERFNIAINRYLKYFAKTEKIEDHWVTFSEERKNVRLNYSDIIYLEANRRHTIVHTNEKIYCANKSLKYFASLLSGTIFYRIHKGFIVNLSYARDLKADGSARYTLQLNDSEDSKLTVSRKYSANLKLAYKSNKVLDITK